MIQTDAEILGVLYRIASFGGDALMESVVRNGPKETRLAAMTIYAVPVAATLRGIKL
jgi:hypothetical protein